MALSKDKDTIALAAKQPMHAYHRCGLDIMDGDEVLIDLGGTPESANERHAYMFQPAGSTAWLLDASKITSIKTFTKEDIETCYEPSLGWAAAGGVLAGIPGIILGSLVSNKKSITRKSYFLTISYRDEYDDEQWLVFEYEPTKGKTRWTAKDFVADYENRTGYAAPQVKGLGGTDASGATPIEESPSGAKPKSKMPGWKIAVIVIGSILAAAATILLPIIFLFICMFFICFALAKNA